jgi:hypothetical protein
MEKAHPRKAKCSGSAQSRQIWWAKTNTLRLRRMFEHTSNLHKNTLPTLERLKKEKSELEQMMMLNSILQDLITKLPDPKDLGEEEKVDLRKYDLIQIALRHNRRSSPFYYKEL